MKKLTYILLSVLLLASCAKKEFIYDYPLALSSVKNELAATSGRTQVIVYANGDWSASLPDDCDWASLEQDKGHGLGEFVFNWKANGGAVRKTTVTVVCGLERTKIDMVQKSGVGVPTITFPYTSVTVARVGGNAVIPFETNIPSSEIGKARLSVRTSAGTAVDWVRNATLYAGALGFEMDSNDGTASRSAIFTVEYTDEIGSSVTSNVTVKQSLSTPSINFDAASAYTQYFCRPSTVKIPFTTNMSLFIPSLLAGAETNTSWAVVRHDGKNADYLTIDLEGNTKSQERVALVSMSYTDPAGVSYVFGLYLVQKAYSEAVSMSQLKATISGDEGTAAFPGEGILEAIVIGDCTNANMDINPLTGSGVRDFTVNARTNYLTATDGSDGLRVLFDSKDDHLLRRGQRVYVDLHGLTLRKEANPTRYTLEGLSSANVSVSPEAGGVVVRERTLSTLTDEDIYTCVKLKGLEFTFKSGAYTNSHDGYQRLLRLPNYPNSRGEAINYGGAASGYQLEDCTPCSLRDASGKDIYALINDETPWRRYGNGVPQGCCDVTGILTHSVLPGWAYRGDLGRYQVRILEEEDIAPVAAAFSKTLIAWNWGKGASSLSREEAAKPTYPENPAFSSMTSNMDGLANVKFNNIATHDYNNLVNPVITGDDANSKGLVSGGCISWGRTSGLFWASDNTADLEAAPWFCFGFSTASVSGTNLVFNWTAAQGTSRGTATNIFAPSVWKVEYSTDGTTFTALDKTYAIHPIVWWKNNCAVTAVDGLHMYTTALPATLFGQDRVYVRIRAAAAKAIASDYSSEDGGVLKDSDNYVRFGEISVQYN
ncbi:MAG: BACON domain-containing protein [Bacteroidales bacterium]|nr:BACON domain-containing protein [Bacteroidales bacterium]